MYRQAVALSVGLCVLAPLARPQLAPPALTVDQLVELAVTRNREFLSAQQRIRAAQGARRQAIVGIADTVEISGSAGQAFGTSGEDNLTATYSHTFETFGKRGRRVAVAESEVALAGSDVADRRRSLAYDVKLRYAEVASERQKLEAIEHLAKVNQDYLRLTEARVEKGDAAPLEADLLRVEISRDQSQRAQTEGKARSALLQLTATLDDVGPADFSVSTSLTVPAFVDDLDSVKALALRNRPDLLSAQRGVEQARAQASLAAVETKPNVTVSGLYSHSDAAFDQLGLSSTGAPTPIRDHVNSLGIGFAIPLTTGARNRGNIEVAAAHQTESQLKLQYLAHLIPTQVEAAYERWKSARQAMDIFTQGVIAQSEKNLNVMRQAYTLGELRLIDVLNEQRRLLDTELSYIDTKTELFRAYAELEMDAGGSLQ